ncbi:MBL fold metallo-hydrolase [Amycolatopsis sp. lyj-109]|uniref:MBL fold metallo-hydrolase n=1 Tax=Amycolatopsis sp. lyj-109 TaxID=2789287 RepID=UPI00397AFE21
MGIRTTFIGHQSWLVDIDGTAVLVDPVLTGSFGHSEQLRFEIHPARSVDVGRMPEIAAVVVTNEHLDHFHLPSLALVPVGAPILLPSLTPAVCVSALRRLGHEVRLLAHGVKETVGAIDVALLQGDPEAPIWESRVACASLTPAGREGGVLIQSDTAIDDHPSLTSLRPEVVIATHNGQITPAAALGAFDNLLPLGDGSRPETQGIELLDSVLNKSLEFFPHARWVLLSGGGYAQLPRKHGEFLWSSFTELAELANKLTMKVRVVGLLPGETADFSGTGEEVSRASWISPADPMVPVAASDRHSREEVDLGADLPPLFDDAVDDVARDAIWRNLDAMAPLLLNSRLGRALVTTNSYLGEPTASHRFAIHLRGFTAGTDAVLALNINSARFEQIDLTLKEALYGIPSGIDVNAADLAAVFTGQVHIWELATARMRQWYLTSRLDSPVAFLYAALSEQVRPDLAEALYRKLTERVPG